MAITDDIGEVVRDYEYDVYGRVTGGSGTTPNEFDFAGQQTDDSTGLQYLRARYCDPETGVFISRDPLASDPTWLSEPYRYGSRKPSTRAPRSDGSQLPEPGSRKRPPTSIAAPSGPA